MTGVPCNGLYETNPRQYIYAAAGNFGTESPTRIQEWRPPSPRPTRSTEEIAAYELESARRPTGSSDCARDAHYWAPLAGDGLISHWIGAEMICPYLDRTLLPLVVALPRVLEKIETNSRTRPWAGPKSGGSDSEPS
jgi:hypothetical protein